MMQKLLRAWSACLVHQWAVLSVQTGRVASWWCILQEGFAPWTRIVRLTVPLRSAADKVGVCVVCCICVVMITFVRLLQRV